MKGKDMQFGIFAILILGLIAVIFFSFVNKVSAASPTAYDRTPGGEEIPYTEDQISIEWSATSLDTSYYYRIYARRLPSGTALASPTCHDVTSASQSFDDVFNISVAELGFQYQRVEAISYTDSGCSSETSGGIFDLEYDGGSLIFEITDEPLPPVSPFSQDGNILFALSTIIAILSFMSSGLIFSTFLPNPNSNSD